MQPIIDLHTDFVLACYERGNQFKSRDQINLELLKKANVKIFFAGFSYDDIFKDSDHQLKILFQQIKQNKLTLVLNQKTLDRVLSDSKRGVIIHLEGAKILENDPEKILDYYHQGVRSLSLTHSGENSFAGGNKTSPKIPLSSAGKKLIKLCQKLGIIVDLSHINERGFYQALEILEQPPVVTHTCSYQILSDPRNLKDEQIKAVAKKKGLIGVFFSAKYVGGDKPVSINNVVKHFLHIAKVGGTEILAIGSDFGGITTGLPQELENTGKLSLLLKKLRESGFSSEDIKRIAFKNSQRVIKKILPD